MKHCYTNYFGAETTNVHDAILAYRAAWDPYVMGVLRDIGTIAHSFDTVAKAPPSGYTAEQLTDAAKKYRDVVQAILAEWNQFSGLAPDKWEEESSYILKAWQDVTMKVGSLVTTETGGGFAQGITWPTAPSDDVQRKVYLDLATAKVDLTSMNVLKSAAAGGLEGVATAVGAIGKAAGEAAGGAAGGILGGLMKTLPWYAWVVIAGVGAVAVSSAVAPIMAPLALLLPKKEKHAPSH